MPRSLFYGKLDASNTPSEVKQIWHTRDDELEPLPQHKWSFDYITDLEQVEQRELLEKILGAAKLNEQHWLVLRLRTLGGCTLEEVGQELGVCKDRVRQIESKMIRILRGVQQRFTGIKDFKYLYVHPEVMTWEQWKSLRGALSTLS